MLLELSIRDFAIIDALRVEFQPGFNALTGETGAGKSIVIDALGAVLGGKVAADLVRADCPQAHVEAVFNLPTDATALAEVLTEQGIAPEDGTLILSRDIHASGRSTCRVNGRTITAQTLQRIGECLVDIHGQSDHLSLLRPATHIDLLDRFANLQADRKIVADGIVALRRLRAELASLERGERDVAQRLDLLRFQVQEIQAAHPLPDEEAALDADRARLANAERLSSLADTVVRSLRGAEARGPRGTLDALAEAVSAAADLARLDTTRTATHDQLQEAYYVLEELARDTRAYRDGIEHNPRRLEALDDRLQLLRDLKRKYGASLEEVLAHAATAEAELELLANRDERAATLRVEEARLAQRVGEDAARLSRARALAGTTLAEAVEPAMAELNMGRARFVVHIEQRPALDGVPVVLQPGGPATVLACDTQGVDRVEFLISTNPGEPIKPLARVASGGETARLMLALKSVLATVDATPTLVFDEIDVGVGGRGGQTVGEKLWELSRDGAHQVLCISHLAQIAAFAETHFRISKQQLDNRTTTRVGRISAHERVDELAAMLGGLPIDELGRANAAALLQRVRAWQEARRAVTAGD